VKVITHLDVDGITFPDIFSACAIAIAGASLLSIFVLLTVCWNRTSARLRVVECQFILVDILCL